MIQALATILDIAENKADLIKVAMSYLMPFSLLTSPTMAMFDQQPMHLQTLLLSNANYLRLALMASQIICLPFMAWGIKSLTEMVIFEFGHKTIFIMAVSVVPFWLVSFFFFGWNWF